MRSVRVTAITQKTPEEFWNKIVDIKNWANVIKFVKKIYIKDDVLEGTCFYDITTIFWFPVRIKHKITQIVPNKKFYMQAHMPFSTGIMYQNIDISRKKDSTEIVLEIKFKIHFFLFDLVFGPILERRLKIMLVETLNKLRDDLGGEIISE